MNTVIEAQMKKFSEENSLIGYKQETLFEKFSIFAVEEGFLNSGIESLDVHFEGAEYGIDGGCIIVHGELVSDVAQIEGDQLPIDKVEFHFFQSKTGEKFKTGEILKFFDAVENFFSKNYKTKSDDLEALKKVSEHIFSNSGDLEYNPIIRLYYATTGNYKKPDDIEELKQRFKSRLEDKNLFSEIDVKMVGARNLQEWFRAATQSIKTTITFDKAVTLPKTETIKESYIGYIDAVEIVKLVANKNIDTINKSVFYENIRDYNPDSDINQRISKSLDDGEGNLFVFRNNGITAVAKKVKSVGNEYTITDYQIVNGCQTSHILFECKEKVADVKVPFRLIEAEDDASISSIIVGTNLQNPVKKEQFWALTKFMKDFEEYCASLEDDVKLFIERRDNQYRGVAIEKVRIMPPNILLKAVTSVLFFVGNRAGRAYAGVFREYSDRLFKDNHDVSVYHAAAFIHFQLDSFWRRNKFDRKYKIFRYYILTGIGIILTGNKNLFDLGMGKAKTEAQRITSIVKDDENFEALLILITDVIDQEVLSVSTESISLRDHIKTEAVSKILIDRFENIQSPF